MALFIHLCSAWKMLYIKRDLTGLFACNKCIVKTAFTQVYKESKCLVKSTFDSFCQSWVKCCYSALVAFLFKANVIFTLSLLANQS